MRAHTHTHARTPTPRPRTQEPKACSVVLRGASKDVLNEVERNLADAMGVARNVLLGERGRVGVAWGWGWGGCCVGGVQGHAPMGVARNVLVGVRARV